MEISIRKAASHDARDIAHIHVAAWRATYRGIVPQSFLDSLDVNARAEDWSTWLEDAESHLYVAEADGLLCGFIGGGRLREPIKDANVDFNANFDAEIYAIYLLPSAKRQGIGKLLTTHLAAALYANGFASMAVWVLADNPSRQFYECLGGRQIAQKQIRIADADLLEIAYGWQDIRILVNPA